MKFGKTVMYVGLAALFVQAPLAWAADPITEVVKGAEDIAGATLNTAAGAVKLTVDAAGNVVDVAGHTVKVTADTTGYLLDPVSGELKGTVLKTGKVLDLTGAALTTGTGLLLVKPTTGVVVGTLGATCNLIPIAETVRGRGKTLMTAFIVDPATGLVKGTVNAAGDILDLSGTVIRDASFKGFTIINPGTRIVTGTISDVGKVIAVNITPTTITNVPSPAAFVVDPITGTVRGAVDVTGAVFDATGKVIAGTEGAGLVLVDATGRGLRGVIDRTGKVVNTILRLPAPASITTTTTTTTR